ncbi:unnamed protein product [Orchesella dallaii]|uniref:G-protein coupled receptors family 3 profile domain-containing protein n=1 Tax=Orchesella dallaii TaxID=48710 RepID=A0ABP1RWA5_9HEXA
MTSHIYYNHCDHGLKSLPSHRFQFLTSSTVVLLLFLLSASPSSVQPYKAGHVEPVPGSSILRNSGPSHSQTSKSLMLMKLASSRVKKPLVYETSKPGYYDQTSQSFESREEPHTQEDAHAAFVRFPTIHSPFSQSSEERQQKGNGKGHKFSRGSSSSPSSSLVAQEEPSSLFMSDDEYYTTGSDATLSSIDIDRYSQETDLYEKQTATSINSSVAPESNAVPDKGNNSSSSNNTNNIPLSKPTLLPANYLSLASFRPIDGTLERSSSSIISRIANFWRSMSNKNNSMIGNVNSNSSNISSSSNSSNNHNYDHTNHNDTNSSVGGGGGGGDEDASKSSLRDEVYVDYDEDGSLYTQLKSDTSLSIDDKNHNHETESVLLKNINSGSTTSSLQPSKFISVEDNISTGRSFSGGASNSKQQYLALDDGEDDIGIGSEPLHPSNSGGLEDTSETDSSSGDTPSFHDDLFHTTGTITAIIDKDDHLHQDLTGSSSTAEEQRVKSDSSSSSTVPVAKGEVKKAESDKIWSIDSHFGRDELIESEEDQEYYGMTIGGFLKRELWTIPLFVLAALNMMLIILFEVYVLCRARGQSRRHLFLGQMLLFGLFLCSFLALMFAVHPSIIGCFVGRLGVGITYSLIFSVLMVKCVFLLSLDTGVYLPTSYQGILLFFSVAVQVAIDTQWVIIYPPFLQTVESGRSILLQCGTSFVQLLYSLSYVGFLVIMVGFLAGRAAYKGVVENYRESVYILITAVVTVPVALSWTVAGWMLQGRHQDACVSFGLVAHSLTTFLIMFMPKGRQLASLDKEGVCFEDQEDQCSGYSPSFFHFKPSTKNYKTALWGDGNLYTTLEPTVSTINPNVFFHRNDFHSGMIY